MSTMKMMSSPEAGTRDLRVRIVEDLEMVRDRAIAPGERRGAVDRVLHNVALVDDALSGLATEWRPVEQRCVRVFMRSAAGTALHHLNEE